MSPTPEATMIASNPPPLDDNVAAVLYGKQNLRIERRQIIPPGNDEVTIRIRATTLCGSDLHYFTHGRNGDFALAHPMCLGHESAGEVVAVGAHVTTLQIGSRIVIEPGVNCQTCHLCTSGRYNLCPNLRFASSAKTKPHLDGTLQRFINWPARLCHAIPPQLSFKIGALVEPLSVILQAFDRANFQAGTSVLILGAGAVGLIACQVAKSCGASFIAAVDVDNARLQFAKHRGLVNDVFCSASDASLFHNGPTAELDRVKAQAVMINDMVSGQSAFDVVFECSGAMSSIQTCIFCAKPGGKVVLVGMGHPVLTLPLGQAALNEVDLIGVFRYANMFPKAIQMLSTGVIPVTNNGEEERSTLFGIDQLITHTFPLQRSAEAFLLMQSPASERESVMKVSIVD